MFLIELLINRWRIPFLEQRMTVYFYIFPKESSGNDKMWYLSTYIPSIIILFTLVFICIKVFGFSIVNPVLFSIIFSFSSVFLYYMSNYVKLPSFNPKGTPSPAEKKFGIHEAAESGDIEKLKQILSQGGDLARKTNKNMTALHLAIKAEKLESVKFLVDAGANLELIGDTFRGKTPLMMAAKTGNLELVKYLLGKGANINSRGKDGNNVLYVSYENIEIFDYLLSHGADIENINSEGMTLLTTIMVRIPPSKDEIDEFIGLTQKIIDHGIPADGLKGESSFPLLEVTSFGNYKAMEFLLKNGATPNNKDQYDRVPILVAVHRGRLSHVKLLLSHGADIKLKGKGEYTQNKDTNSLELAKILLDQQTEAEGKEVYKSIIKLLNKSTL